MKLYVLFLALPFGGLPLSGDMEAVYILDVGDAAPVLDEPWPYGPQFNTH